MTTIAVYGSLKAGKYNHNSTRMKRVGDSSVMGSMFLCGSYPHLYPEDRSVPEQVMQYPVELYEVDDDYFGQLDRMERGAGYTGHVQLFQTGDKQVEATIWFKNGEGKDSRLPYITSY